MNISDVHYVACWTEDDGIYSCGHLHPDVRDAMNCLVPDGGSFIRSYDAGGFRSLNEVETVAFLRALGTMPWSWRSKAQGGALAVTAMR